jgi:hypothetical protein
VPSVGPVFYIATLLPQSHEVTINVDLTLAGDGMLQTMGFVGTLDQPMTFPIGLFSDAPTSGPWNLTIELDPQISFPDMNGNPINNGTATVTLDKSSGTNGDVVNVTVTPTAWSPLGVVYFSINSLVPGDPQPHFLPILVSQH